MKQKIVTVFGGTGFVGSYIVEELAKTGVSIKVVSRDPERAMPIKTAGTAGQIVLAQANLHNEASVRRAVENSEVVINLVGILFESGKQNFTAVHSQGAELLAKAAKEAGVKRFIHMSALGIDKPSQSKYARTKLTGEKAVHAAFPDATIIRPSVIFGHEDNFFNKFAEMASFSPFLPLIGSGKTKFQPVYVGDIAKAFAKVVSNPYTAGKTYELGGPDVYTFRELMELMLRTIHKKRLLVSVPYSIASLKAAFLELLPHPLLTRDQVQLLKVDNIVSDRSLTFKDLGITPTALESIIPNYLERYAAA